MRLKDHDSAGFLLGLTIVMEESTPVILSLFLKEALHVPSSLATCSEGWITTGTREHDKFLRSDVDLVGLC